MLPRMLHISLPSANECNKTCVHCPMHISNCRLLRHCIVIRIIPNNIQYRNLYPKFNASKKYTVCIRRKKNNGRRGAVKWLPIQYADRANWIESTYLAICLCFFLFLLSISMQYVCLQCEHCASVLYFICRCHPCKYAVCLLLLTI